VKDLLATNLFTSISSDIMGVAGKISAADKVILIAPADVEGAVALSQLEASLLDQSKNYQRKLLPPRKHNDGTEDEKTKDFEGLVIEIQPFFESQSMFEVDGNRIKIFPLSVGINLSKSKRDHHGAIECVALCAAIAHNLSPDGVRVRKQRPLAISGSWLRGAFDTNYDPVYSLLRDHLKEEGSLDIRPMPEVAKPLSDMIPNFPERMFKRLVKSWSSMDFQERGSALSELVLPSLRSDELPTMLIEELIWHRLVIPGVDMDLASQLYKVREEWPSDIDSAKLHAGRVIDSIISSGTI